ncbi:Uma2 family endonuclease [Coleofasciculus sp. FACHB-SPT9]|uniref:Uma2 family endonuclease n=1 Tax=Cyanophyceae TaxID=3028117 RepID=UPI00168289B4|nr:Uma2 family endonuclease [Coleofasciculus sp. FACHB-SPT9]MBD1888729.1 Uma2 family endonuclease [Coleofasciculus sp. FACHB-SPT9]
MSTMRTKLPTDTWIVATWDEFIQTIEDPAYQKAKGYYSNRRMRIETMSVGPDHAKDNGIIAIAVTLFAALKNIPLNCLDNCSYRKTGVRECQPDVSYYIGEKAQMVPIGTAIANLDITPPPDIAIEISDTTLADDKGEKRLLYEDIKVSEYWIVDVQQAQIIAFEIISSGSRRITQSQVLPGLKMAVLEETLRRSRQMAHSQVVAWLLTQFQQ